MVQEFVKSTLKLEMFTGTGNGRKSKQISDNYTGTGRDMKSN
jgi:hypothetical protein